MNEQEKFFKALNQNRVRIYTTGSIDDEWQQGMKTGSVDRREYEIYVQPETQESIDQQAKEEREQIELNTKLKEVQHDLRTLRGHEFLAKYGYPIYEAEGYNPAFHGDFFYKYEGKNGI